MPKINILDKDVYNKIAAGEVVEKPASVVKELVENSIDAGATNITIEILNGGIDRIKVIDNGCGIEKDDFSRVFLAHATSKIKDIDDLISIGTLGFRGEALSSIASVSKVTLISKTENDIGYELQVNGGELDEIKPIGSTTGTCMIVEDLFFNIPVRKKFLRKPKLEENDITNLISRLILANPNISIKYSADNKIVYQSFGNGLFNAIYAIYGKSIVDNIFEFSFKKDDFDFSGYLCKPTFSKPNRTYQTLIINGRYVINQTISTAIYKAYENFIMKGTFPFFVINLNIPLDKVDVNVHPNKLDVKFEDSNKIFGIVYSSVIDILYNVNNTKSIVTSQESISNVVNPDLLEKIDNQVGSKFNFEEYKSEQKNDSNKYDFSNLTIKEVNLGDDSEKVIENKFEEKINTSSIFNFQLNSPSSEKNEESQNAMFSNESINKSFITEKKESVQTSIVPETIKTFRIIGTLFNTYILIENENNLQLIDQHAGHERLLFDKFNLELEHKNVAIQSLLVPYILETNSSERIFINNNLDILQELGFEIDAFGDNSFKINSVPLLLNNINIQEFFDNILKDIDNNLIVSKTNTLKNYLAKNACKSAVKGKDVLTENEIEYLINKLYIPGQVLLCPHGRPIIINITEKEIEKWFKRIV